MSHGTTISLQYSGCLAWHLECQEIFPQKASKRFYTIANMTHGKYLAIHIRVVSNHVMLDNITLVRIETILQCESCQAMGHIIAFAICLMINALLCMPHSNLKVLGFWYAFYYVIHSISNKRGNFFHLGQHLDERGQLLN